MMTTVNSRKNDLEKLTTMTPRFDSVIVNNIHLIGKADASIKCYGFYLADYGNPI